MSVILFTAFIAAVLYRTTPMGAEESFRKAVFSSSFAAYFHRICNSRLHDNGVPVLVGYPDCHHADRCLCRKHHRRYEMHPNGDIWPRCHRNEFKHIVHPNAVLPVRVNKQVISPAILLDGTGILIHLCRASSLSVYCCNAGQWA